MPPRAPEPAFDSAPSETEDASTKQVASSKPDGSSEPSLGTGGSASSSLFRNTFHWELNLYSWAMVGFLYRYVIPTRHQVWMHAVLALIALDAAKYYYYKGSKPGVPYTLPLVSLLAMLIHPVRFWAEMANIAMESGDGMCTNTLVGNFLVFCTSPQHCRTILTDEASYGIYAHPNALWLFGPKNLIYLQTDRHKKFRSILTPALFSHEALRQYAVVQEQVVRQYLAKYAAECQATGQPLDARLAMRTMAAASSQESFLGPYLNDELREHLTTDIQTFTMGFLSFPFPYLRFGGLYDAIQAKARIEETLKTIVPKARAHAEAGLPPRCMIEQWSTAIYKASLEQGCDAQAVDCCNDDDMARTVLDFLFAAQDATNSALTYSMDVLAAEQDKLVKLRQEVDAVVGRNNEAGAWPELRDTSAQKLPYTHRVANQMLHHKPPVPMIPLMNRVDAELGGHWIPKGTVTIPNITYSSRVSGASLEFDPDRKDQDSLFVKCITFGAGQHKCPGRRYAELLLTVFLTVIAADYEWERVGPRPTADEFIYFPTVFPVDSYFLLTPRPMDP